MSLPVSVPLQPTHGRSITADRILLRLSSTLPFIGFLLYALASIFHHDPANSNNHIVTFTLYAANGFWTAVHLGPFTTAGIFHIYCTIHRGMNLTIVVQ